MTSVHLFLLVTILFLAHFNTLCYSARILVLFPVGSTFPIASVIEVLAENGHQLTVVSAVKSEYEAESVREIIIVKNEKLISQIHNLSKDNILKQAAISSLLAKIDLLKEGYDNLVNTPDFQQILNTRNVDLIIADADYSDFTYPIIDHLEVPFILHKVSNPELAVAAAYSSNGPTVGLQCFKDRLFNIITAKIIEPICRKIVTYMIDKYIQKDFPQARPILIIEKDASLWFIHNDPITSRPLSLPPTVVSLGASHARLAKTLPMQLRNFADTAAHGLIIFNLGFYSSSSYMSNDTFHTLLRVFNKLPQKVVWKWDVTLPNVPSNIMIIDYWFPQQDLLGHPNTKLFVTHGGLWSIQEAIFHGVPLMILPFDADHCAKATKTQEEGFCLTVDSDQINEKNLFDFIVKLIYDPKFHQNALKSSRIMHDELIPGKKIAAYWVDYLLRHAGAKHLQLASKDMPFYQTYLLDVFLLLVVLAILFLYVSYAVVCYVWRKIFKRDHNVKVKSN